MMLVWSGWTGAKRVYVKPQSPLISLLPRHLEWADNRVGLQEICEAVHVLTL